MPSPGASLAGVCRARAGRISSSMPWNRLFISAAPSPAVGSCGTWKIPMPESGDSVFPDILVVPLVGFDGQGYRLGYGGGFYDRTIAAMPEQPRTIGVGFEL